MTLGSLFDGISGFPLAASWAGIETKWISEIDPYCLKVSKKNFPNAIQYGDIKEIGKLFRPEAVDIISGGFPCQPFSVAGKRKGGEDDRYLWPEMLRVIGEVRPRWVVGENVAGLLSMENGKTLERVFVDLESQGYKVEPYIIPACGVGAWHKRDRIWIIAHNNSNGFKTDIKFKEKHNRGNEEGMEEGHEYSTVSISCDDTNDRSQRNERQQQKEILSIGRISRGEDIGIHALIGDKSDISTPILCRTYDGIPNGVDRIKSLGNAIVPQVAYEIFKAIKEIDKN